MSDVHYFSNPISTFHNTTELRIFASFKSSQNNALKQFACSEDGKIFVSAGESWKEKPTFAAPGSPYLKFSIKTQTRYVHRIIAMSWLPKPINYRGLDVNHIDSDKSNNHASNLEWVTHRLNTQLRPKKTEKQMVGTVFAISLTTGRMYEYPTQTIAAERSGISQSAISTCLRSKRKTAGGSIWFNYAELYSALEALNAMEVAV